MRRRLSFVVSLSAACLVALLQASETTLPDAAMRSDHATVRSLLERGIDVNTAQGDGLTALHWAALKNDVALAKILVGAGANLNAPSRLGAYTPLLLAAKDGSVDMVEALVNAGADTNAATTNGTTALMLAARSGKSASVTALLDRGARIDAQEAKGQTALMFAAAFGRAEVIRVLAARKADVRLTSRSVDLTIPPKEPPPPEPGRIVVDPNASQLGRAGGNFQHNLLIAGQGGLAPLHFAARQGHVESVKALLTAGADVNQRTIGDKTSPLLIATINGRFDLAKFLLEQGADPHAASENGVTPLYAVLNCQWAPIAAYPQPRAYEQQQTTYLDLMAVLLDKGADPNARINKKVWYSGYNFDQSGVNEAGATPFWRAAYASDLEAMRRLVERGADPRITTMRLPPKKNEAHDPGQRAFVKGYVAPQPAMPVGGADVTPLLAAAGVGYADGAGNSHRFAPTGMMAAVKYLVETLHADVNAADASGNTALHHAAGRGDNEMILYLVSKGANPHAVNRDGLTVVDMANGPVQKVQPFPETIALLEKLGVTNNHLCVSC